MFPFNTLTQFVERLKEYLTKVSKLSYWSVSTRPTTDNRRRTKRIR